MRTGESLRVACVQLNVSDRKTDNVKRAAALVAVAAAEGARVVVLPEKWNAMGPPEVMRENAESLSGGTAIDAMRAWAREHAITVIGGSICERRSDIEKLSNTCLVFDPSGELVATYRKIHMFDVDVGGHSYRESDVHEPGTELVLCELEGWLFGLSVCYDLRFPELYRALAVAGAEILVVPAAFTLETGKDHWELLLRARAVENQCYVTAAAQWGIHPAGRATYGRSMLVDPWGLVLGQAPDEDSVVVADLDRRRLETIRTRLPSLRSRNPAAYGVPGGP